MRKLILLTFLSTSALAQAPAQPSTGGLTPQQYDQLSQRFLTTVKETQVDRQLLTQPNLQQCVQQNQITASDSAAQIESKKSAAQGCFRTAFANSTEADLNALSDQLGLEAFGVVRSKRAQDLMQFFSTRIENALYGPNADQRTKDKTVVNHSTYKDIYDSVLSKNVLLEITNFCYQHVPTTSGNTPFVAAVNQWKGLSQPCINSKTTKDLVTNNCIPGTSNNPLKIIRNAATDSRLNQPTTSSVGSPAPASTARPSIYDNISQDLQSVTSQQAAKDDLKDSFNHCANYIPHLCTVYTYCKLKMQTPPSPNLAQYDIDSVIGSKCDDIVQVDSSGNITSKLNHDYDYACVVQEKLQAFRIALKAVEGQKSFYRDLETTGSPGFDGTGVAVYNGSNISNDRSAVGIANVSSSELKTFNDQQTKNYNDEFTREGCEQNPESKNCEKFFYTDAEDLKFKNLGLTYIAATEAEKARIKGLESKRDDLKKYLQTKGYTDLARQLDQTGNATQIVALAQDRFAAEREASYQAMASAFEEKQMKRSATPQDKTDKAKRVKEQYNRTGAEFNQLLLFNNVVTSFLTVTDGSGQSTTNKDALDAEIREMQRSSDPGASTAVSYFSSINTGNGSSGGGNNRSVGIDVSFIDGIIDTSSTTGVR